MTPRPASIEYFKSNVRPAPSEPIWKWAEREIYLSAKQATGFPGRYKSSLTPYVQGVLDALQDRAVRKVTVEKGAQTGLTLTGYVWAAWTVAESPAPTLFMYPSENLARSASETRFMPMVEDSPALREKMPEDKDDWTKLQQKMEGATLNWLGANSPANLASRPAKNVFEDEVDKYPINNQREATPMALIEQRAKTFWDSTIFQISTPTTPDGAIHSEYIAGDQSRFFVPCRKCGAMQFFKWSQVKWDESNPQGAWYECDVCGVKHTDAQKNAAVKKGEWRATAKARTNGHKSFHVSSIYSPWTKLGDLAVRFLQVKDFPGEFQDFINSELGEPFERIKVYLRDGVIADREGQYEKGECFVESKLYADTYRDKESAVFIGVDVQKTHLVVVARQFCKNGDSGQIDHCNLSGFKALAEYADKMNAHSVMVDSGYRTQEVYEASLHYRFVPTKGSSFRIPGVWEQTTRNIDEGTRRAKQGRVVGIVLFDPDQLKDQMYDRIEGTSPFAWLVPKGTAMDVSYCAQMQGEARDDKGKWKPVRPNATVDYWDAEILTLLGATVYGYNAYIMEDAE